MLMELSFAAEAGPSCTTDFPVSAADWARGRPQGQRAKIISSNKNRQKNGLASPPGPTHFEHMPRESRLLVR